MAKKRAAQACADDSGGGGTRISEVEKEHQFRDGGWKGAAVGGGAAHQGRCASR